MNSTAPAKKCAPRLLPLLIALSACEQVIEPDLPDHTPRLVVHSLFTSDGGWSAHVGRSTGILQPLPHDDRAVADADVRLLTGERVVGELRFDEAAQVYVLEDGGLQAGETYSLEVSAPGFETVRATDTVPVPVPTSVRPGLRGDFSIEIEIELQDPPGEANYYQVSLYLVFGGRGATRVEGLLSTRDPSILADSRVDDSPIEEGGFEGAAPYFRDTLFDGQTHQIELTYAGDWVEEVGTIIREEAEEEWAQDDQEHAGFAAYLQVLYISETYYEYLKTARLHDEIRENPFAEPLNVHGNVENGYGIFAGYSSRTFEFTLGSDFDSETE